MALTDLFHGRNTVRQGRSGITTTPTKKLRDREDRRSGAFGEDTIGPLGVIFCLLLVAASVAILDYGVLPPVYEVGRRPPADVPSRLDFAYNDPNVLNRKRADAAEKAPHVYEEDPAWVEKVMRDFVELIQIVEVSDSPQNLRDRSARFPADRQLAEELYKYHQEQGPLRRFLSSVLRDRVRSSLQVLADNGILLAGDLELERDRRGERRILVRTPPKDGKGEPQLLERPFERLRSVARADEEIMRASWQETLPAEVRRQIGDHLITHIGPNLTLNTVLTAKRREQAQDAITEGSIIVKRGELILDRHNPIAKPDLDKLHQEYRAYKDSLPVETRLKHLIGLATAAFGVIVVFLFIAARSEHRLLSRRRGLVMLGLLCIAVLASGRGLLLSDISVALTPFILVGVIASLAFSQTVALLTLFSLSVLLTLAGIRWEAAPIEGGLPALSLALLAGGVAAGIPAARLRDRWDLLRCGAIGGLTQGLLMAGLAWLGIGLTGALPPSTAELAGGAEWLAAQTPRAGVPTIIDAVLALASGPLCGFFVLGTLPLIEALFGILTNIRLFELADLNRPALRRLLEEAPGTFQHTLHVRFLAEPASDAIGANTRLVSAGVLYHDIGKALKPEYFVENQMDAPERHRRLRPSFSALLITAHVKDGIELAREYGLPEQIIAFIPEHHGTTLVSYFFHSAKKEAAAEPDGGGEDSVQEAFFRYPGPKPQSRETAIVMLADTAEAASRILESPSAARLTAFVHELIMEKMLDGQLDECDLTFRDLALIEEAFVRVLVTRSHARIRYPGQENEPGFDSKTTVTEALPGAVIATSNSGGVTTRIEMRSSRKRLTETQTVKRLEPETEGRDGEKQKEAGNGQ
ncbi:MAG TPA: HDIG domain-containing protein [Planctomycetota bacterium]